MTTEELVKINKDYFKSIVSAGAKTALLTYFPWMSVAPCPYLLDMFLDWLTSKIADILEQSAYFIYTDLRISQQGKDYVEAKLKGFKAELSGNLEELKIAQENIKKAFRTFAKFTT